MNYNDEILNAVNSAKNKNQLLELTDSISEKIESENSVFISVNKKYVNYGTWKLTLFVNKYHFGEELTNILTNISKITHDEDTEFSPCDLHDEISNAIFEYAYKLF
mgnify:CR=1 FL=1